MEPHGDKPRKIVVCHSDRYLDVQEAVMKLGYGDVLVQRGHPAVIDTDRVYVIDGSVFDLPPGQRVWPAGA